MRSASQRMLSPTCACQYFQSCLPGHSAYVLATPSAASSAWNARAWSTSLSSVPTSMKRAGIGVGTERSEEHTSELQSQSNLVCRLLLEKKKKHDKSHSHLARDY